MTSTPPSPAPTSVPPGAPSIPAPATRERSTWQTVRSLLPYLWVRGETGSHVRLGIAVVFMLAAKVATVYVPIVYARAVDALTHGMDRADAILAIPVALILAYGLLRIAAAGFAEAQSAVFSVVQQRVARRIALETFRHLHELSLRFHLDRQTGGLSRAIERGGEGIQNVLRLGVFSVLPTLLEVLMVTGILWRLFGLAFAVVILLAVGAYIGFTLGFTNWRVRYRRAMNEIDSEAQTKAVDSLLNYETVKYFGNEAHEAKRFDTALARYQKAAVKSAVSLNALNAGQAVIIAVGLAGVMLMAAQGVHAGTMTVGKFVLVNTYLMQLYTPLNFLGFVYREIKQGLVDTEQMFRLLRVPQEVQDQPGAAVLAHRAADGTQAASVSFQAVEFGYRLDHPILRGVSFSVPAGHKLAIVGPTGAGKSTISRLLFRFYDATSGRVVVDGRDVRELAQDSLRAAIGVVPQDTVLFNDTIGYNIGYGRPGATQEQIEQAAKLAQVHDFVMRMPDGYRTVVGERGLKLSGGEKQRVAIARTILKDPRILILDEATSALDTGTEQEIQAALRAVSSQRTTVVIAHRLSTVVDADEIVVLREGQVAERGTHAALMARGGLYAAMWRAQAEQDEETGEAPPEKEQTDAR